MSAKAAWVGSLVTTALLVTGCTGHSAEGDRPVARFATAPCPDDVEVLIVPDHRCGTVVSRRGSGIEVAMFVVVVDPPDPSQLAPILETGTDLGMTPAYGGLAPIAQRTGRRTVIVDLPGTGHSQPSLACPEVERLPAAEQAHRLSGAIRACRARIANAGVEPEDLTPSSVAEDLFAVMTAFDSPRWVLQGHGTTAAAAVEVAREHPDRVEAMVLDSLVQADAHAGRRVDDIVDDVAAECTRDGRCRGRYGAVADLWREAEARAGKAPLVVGGVVIDRRELERAIRWLVAPVAKGPSELPALLEETASGTPGVLLHEYASAVAGSPPLCVGYLPKCDAGQQVSLGAMLSTLCPTSADLPEWRRPCRAWGIDVDGSPPVPVEGVPTLAVYGRFDPFAAPADIRRELAVQVPHAFVVEDPVAGHNVLGEDCIRGIRNVWLAGDHKTPPPIPDCLSTAQIHFE